MTASVAILAQGPSVAILAQAISTRDELAPHFQLEHFPRIPPRVSHVGMAVVSHRPSLRIGAVLLVPVFVFDGQMPVCSMQILPTRPLPASPSSPPPIRAASSGDAAVLSVDV
uniref:Uncharacterized protein n=1 Tax=Prorocentrum micans TaxID=2945 RepID=A0A7S2TCB1_PROMC